MTTALQTHLETLYQQVDAQARLWSGGYVIFALLTAATALTLLRGHPASDTAAASSPAAPLQESTQGRGGIAWIAMAAS